MAINVCDCEDNGLGNLGAPNCEQIAGVTGAGFILPTYKADGTLNSIDLSVDLDQAFFQDKLFNAEPSERWQLIKEFEDVTNERAEAVVQELSSGRKFKIRDGKKSFSGDIYGHGYTYLSKLKMAGCVHFSMFPIDLAGNIIGKISDDGTKLYPVKIDKESYSPIFVEKTSSTQAKINISFDWAVSEKDEELKMITANEYTADLDALRSVIDANLKLTTTVAASTTGFSLAATMDYGTAKNAKLITGLLAADFVVKVGGVSKTPDTVVETEDGNYTFDFTGDPISTGAVVTLADGIAFEENTPLIITF